MHRKQLKSVSRLPPDERYGYFLRKVADFEEVWGLFDGGWAVMGNDDGSQMFPFWPEPEFAEALATDSWESYTPKSITLDAFVERWLPGMSSDGIRPAVFPTAEGKGIVVDASRLLADLKEESAHYE